MYNYLKDIPIFKTIFWLFKPMPEQFLDSETQGNQYLEELIDTWKTLELDKHL